MLLLALACQHPPGGDDVDTPPVDADGDVDTDADADADADADTDFDTDTGTLADPCEVDPGLTVEVEHDQPWNENELRLFVTTPVDASVAVACTLRGDPAEVHLVEGEVGTEHELRLAGLLADSDYDCVAAAVCPASAAPTAFQVHTREPAQGLAEIVTMSYGDHGDEYVLVNQFQDCGWEYGRLRVVDRQGRSRWWFSPPSWVGPSLEFRYHGSDTFEWGGGWGPNELGRPRIVDLYDGEIYDSAVALPGTSDFHHDGKQLPDGRLLTLEQVSTNGDFGRFDGFRSRRLDPVTGLVDFEYHGQRAVDDDELPSGFGDAWHANWVDIVDEVLYVSLCNLSWVGAVDVATGDWLWTFGAGGDFELFDENGEPMDDYGFTSCQHGLEMSADHHLLVYDNGWNRGFTRVSEYELDPATMTATRLWTWTEPDWYESTLGDADWLPSGNVLVDAGHAECFSTNPGDHTTIYEIDPVLGEKLWEAQYVDRDLQAYRADWAGECDLFANAAYCDEVATRLAELAPVLGR